MAWKLNIVLVDIIFIRDYSLIYEHYIAGKEIHNSSSRFHLLSQSSSLHAAVNLINNIRSCVRHPVRTRLLHDHRDRSVLSNIRRSLNKGCV